jgi:hypothetical protein
MEDVLEVYHRPYDPTRPVVCLDERAKTLHSTPRGSLPIDPRGRVREDYEYKREGVCNTFLAIEPLAGIRHVQVTARRTYRDFAEYLRRLVDEWYPQAEQLILVTDNLNIHSPAALYECFPPAEARRLVAKLEWHYTPEHGSWLNIAESELSVFSSQCLRRRLASVEEVAREAAAWEAGRNAAVATVRWHFTTQEARLKLRHLYPDIQLHAEVLVPRPATTGSARDTRAAAKRIASRSLAVPKGP